MRRMRSQWQYVLFAVPVLVVAAGITVVNKRQSTSVRAPASVDSSKESPASVSQVHELGKKLKQKLAKMEEDEDAPEQDLRVAEPAFAAAGAPAFKTSEPVRESASPGQCVSEEFPGRSPETAQISKIGWESVMEEFHGAKSLLTSWLEAHRSQFSEKTYQWMSDRISDARLQRPPSAEEPDMSWRGIGAVTYLSGKTPMIRVGAGFEKWVTEKPKRARFELARLLAQTWAPCEMAKVDSSAPWNAFVSCMDLGKEADPSKACASGTFSEAGWAVSSAIAAAASPPGCKIPAFDRAPAAECLKKIGVSL